MNPVMASAEVSVLFFLFLVYLSLSHSLTLCLSFASINRPDFLIKADAMLMTQCEVQECLCDNIWKFRAQSTISLPLSLLLLVKYKFIYTCRI